MIYIESGAWVNDSLDHSQVREAFESGKALVERWVPGGDVEFWCPDANPQWQPGVRYRALLDVPYALMARKLRSDKWDLEEDLAEFLLLKFGFGNNVPLLDRITITRADINTAFPGFFEGGDK